MKPEERAERLTHRIESFSDLVIGFSLALLALTLSIPPHIVDLARHPWWLIAYFWTFAVIARLWYTHQRLFTLYFWPNTLSIFLNFIALSLVGLLVYFVQVFVHYSAASSDRVWAFIAYFTVLGVLLFVVGALHLIGVKYRWNELNTAERYAGMTHAIRGMLPGTFVLIGAIFAASRVAKSMGDIWPVPVAAVIGILGMRVFLNVLKPRIFGIAQAD